MNRFDFVKIETILQHPELTTSDREFIATLSSHKRKREVTAWRSLLRRLLTEMGFEREALSEIGYRESGAPYIVDSSIHISASHSSSTVAVILSTERACAIDIESCDRDFERVASRYTSPHEREILDLATLWSAKECLYKLSGQNGLDLITDITIESYDGESIVGSIKGVAHTLKSTHIDNQVVVYTSL